MKIRQFSKDEIAKFKAKLKHFTLMMKKDEKELDNITKNIERYTKKHISFWNSFLGYDTSIMILCDQNFKNINTWEKYNHNYVKNTLSRINLEISDDFIEAMKLFTLELKYLKRAKEFLMVLENDLLDTSKQYPVLENIYDVELYLHIMNEYDDNNFTSKIRNNEQVCKLFKVSSNEA